MSCATVSFTPFPEWLARVGSEKYDYINIKWSDYNYLCQIVSSEEIFSLELFIKQNQLNDTMARNAGFKIGS